MGCDETSQLFFSSARTNFDTYANYTVYLCAQTLGVLFGCPSDNAHPGTPCQTLSGEEGNSYIHRWRELFGQVEQWHEDRPSQMKSIFTVAQPGYSGIEQPFPMVLYGNGAASASSIILLHLLWLTSTSLGKPTLSRVRSSIASA